MRTDLSASRAITCLLRSLHTLSVYVAAGITSFGWALCQLAGWNPTPWLPLWFCAALLIYNADRLSADPADAVNLPHRTADSHRLRRLAFGLIAAAVLVLVGLPILRGDWLSLGLILGGTLVCLNYSRPLLGFRFKDWPLVKTLFAPTIVTASLLGLPYFHDGPPPLGAPFGVIALRAWLLMFFNMTLCDLRDLEGDRRTGVLSVPVILKRPAATHALLWLLLVVMEGLALTALLQSPAHLARTWQLICLGAPLYLGALLLALRRPRSERFYEWWVEGILFLPALAVLAGRL